MVKEYGYEYDAVLNEALWKDTQGKVTYEKLWDALCLRSGRDTLKTIAREYYSTKVFMPALACNSMVFPFEMYGHKVVYYKLNADYSINLDYLNPIIDDGLFLYMDYFGNQAITDDELEKLRNKYNLVFIEDRTHNLIRERNSSFKPEYIMASLRKWINVPDGGLLWCNRELKNKDFAEDLSFSETRLKAQCMRNEFLNTGNETVKAEYRQIFSTVSDIIDTDKKPSRMSAYSYAIAKNVDWQFVRETRKNNAEVLIDTLRDAGVEFIQDETEISDLYVAFLIKDRDETQGRLSPKGVFNTIIWPLTGEQKDICEVAKYTEEHMLAAPCDQRYTTENMKFIGNEICRAIRGQENE